MGDARLSDTVDTVDAAEIFGPLSQPAYAAVKAARQALRGEAPDDELRDTDAAIVASFAVEHADRLAFDWRRGCWMIRDPVTGIWRPDESGEVRRLLQGYVEQRAFDLVAAASSKRDANAVRAVVRRNLGSRSQANLLEFTKHQAPVAVDGRGWDLDPWMLAAADGQLIDLRSGAYRPLRPADAVTRACGVPLDPSARCDRWRRFILEIADDDRDLAELIRLSLGYTATGAISEQVFFALIGAGANGKSTLLETVAYVLGDLAGVLPFSALTRDRDSRAVQAEVADLPGTRFVRASEIREGVYLDEGRLKALTGGDPISAARKYGHPFVFRPAFKLWLGLNHRPRVSDRSHGFWRRAVLIPFCRTFEPDKALEAQLRAEAPGILAWLVEAAADWQRLGLPRPAAAEQARAEWRDAEDVIGQWASGALLESDGVWTAAGLAYQTFGAWAGAEGLSERERPSVRTFGEWMAARFKSRKTKHGRLYAVALVTGDGCDRSIAKAPYARA